MVIKIIFPNYVSVLISFVFSSWVVNPCLSERSSLDEQKRLALIGVKLSSFSQNKIKKLGTIQKS